MPETLTETTRQRMIKDFIAIDFGDLFENENGDLYCRFCGGAIRMTDEIDGKFSFDICTDEELLGSCENFYYPAPGSYFDITVVNKRHDIVKDERFE